MHDAFITRCLSIRQPWAWLICAGYKDIENRSRRSHFRGRFHVHASLGTCLRGIDFARRLGIRLPRLQSGGIIGSVDMVDCVETHESIWFIGPFGYVLEAPAFSDFLPCRGQLGFFNPPPQIQTTK